MRIAIIETGEPPTEIAAKHPDYFAMFERLLGPLDNAFSFSRWRVFEGVETPAPGAFDAALITGSPAGVYEGHPWIAPLEAFIRNAAAARRPMVGVCFGHQIMAQAFGGKVEKSHKGWGVGVQNYDLTEPTPWMTPAQSRLSCAASHQDQVIDLPPTARRIAGSDFCPNAFLVYDHAPAFSFQPHPEFSHDFARDLLAIRRNRIGEETVSAGISSLKERSDRDLIAKWMVNFLRSNS